MSSLNSLLQQITKNSLNPKLIEQAFEFAKEAHAGQKRFSGEDYIWHPLRIAWILNEMNLDPKTIAAGLLHDVPEDTMVSLDDIDKKFGKEIAFLVEGISKLGKLRYPKTGIDIKPIESRVKNPIDTQAENLRKMFFAMAEDIRVILIKLVDRLDNMRTIEYLPKEKQKRFALETLEIFAPLASRLGIGEIRGALEDLAFPYLYPAEYKWLESQVKERYEERIKYLKKVKPVIIRILRKERIEPINIDFRAKHYWSLYQKLLKHDMDLEKIYDLVALRIITKDVESCYKALGIIHKYWKPLPGRIKDYISLPKPTGYQSLHTTVFCIGGKITEIQIRTPEMHEEAEHGIAAHWASREGVSFNAQRKKFSWVSQLADWQKKTTKTQEFLEGLKIDFFKNRIFIFTPKGDVIDLPEGATPVDFAYSLHTELGNHCSAAKVNGKITPLSQPLKNGDMLEIIIDKNKKPSRDWLESVKTNIAKARIKEWLKKESRPENLNRGLELLNRELQQIDGKPFNNISRQKKEKLLKIFPYKDLDSLIIAVGEGEVRISQILKVLLEAKEVLAPLAPRETAQIKLEKPNIGVALAGEKGILINLAKCCFPQPGKEIKAYITRNRGATVHDVDCINLKRIEKKWPQQIIEASWPNQSKVSYQVAVKIKAEDRIGLLQDISSAISAIDINILGHHADQPAQGKSKTIEMKFAISGLEDLQKIFNQIKGVKGVSEVKKIS